MYRFLVWFLPEALRKGDRDETRRALLCVAACWITVLLSTPLAVGEAVWGRHWGVASALAISLVGAVFPFWIRRTGRWRIAAAVLCALGWLPSLIVGVLSGGQLVAAAYYLVMSQAMAALFFGFRWGLGLGLASGAAVAGIHLMHHAELAFPLTIDPHLAFHSALRGALIINVALVSLIGAYEWLRSATLRDSVESERRYRALAEYGPDLIAEIDPQGRVAYCSALGGEPPGPLALDAIHGDDRPGVTEALRQLDTQPSVRVGPLRWKTRPDQLGWFEASLTRFGDGSERRILVVARDVSDRMALEAQLRQSQKMQAIGQLASGLAHDFNNLLMVVSGYGELLEPRVDGDPEGRAALDEIRRAADRGAALTRRLVGLSQPSSTTRRVLDLNDVVRESERMLQMLLGERISVSLALAPGPLPVRADPGEIEQVLVNLVANARDALPGGGNVRIETGLCEERVRLAVRDDGCGIDPAIRERIFEPFFTTKRGGRGTGLGLYVVHSIASGLGGEIELESELGKGTCVSLGFPLAAPETSAVPAPVDKLLASGGSEQILVVEDRPELRSLIRETLAAAGYRTIVAADGLEALALDVLDRIDLVVTDVVMPRMGGVALLDALRQRRPGLRALLISGYPADASGQRDRVLRKPFLMQELRSAVREVLDAP